MSGDQEGPEHFCIEAVLDLWKDDYAARDEIVDEQRHRYVREIN